MTAEIAILNKSAVALAADSAVTIGEGGSEKIYNTVNKIFEISGTQPLGIMVYGSLSFMGLPLEILIKRYRNEFAVNNTFKNVSDCAVDFARYLESNVPYDQEHENQNIQRIIYYTIDSIVEKSFDAHIAYVANLSVDSTLVGQEIEACKEVIVAQIDHLSTFEAVENFSMTDISRTVKSFDRMINEMINTRFYWLNVNAEIKRLIKNLVKEALYRTSLSKYSTGIVVAGFGEDEICPTLCSFEMDGIVGNKLKRTQISIVDIDRDGPGADVKAFAQREMVERFLQGVDPAYDIYLQNLFEDTLRDFAGEIFLSQGNNETNAQALVTSLEPIILGMKNELVRRSDKLKEEEFRHNVLDMVQVMPNQELATLAESLIDLTSLKRRMSAERETVGGEIDVAIISKYDGFVWIKRKHYFPPELNPRFFKRHYGSDKGGPL